MLYVVIFKILIMLSLSWIRKVVFIHEGALFVRNITPEMIKCGYPLNCSVTDVGPAA